MALCLWLVGLACTGGPADTAVTASDTDADWDNPIFLELGDIPEDSTNRVAADPEAQWLGQALFFDEALSEGGFSCATCHDPDSGFQVPTALAEAAGITGRHAPTLYNTVYQDWFFWDGHADTLWAQALGPLEAENEQATSRVAVVRAVYMNEDYRDSYETLFGELPPMDDEERFPAQGRPVPDDPSNEHNVAWALMEADDRALINEAFANIGKSIAAYERQLVRTESPFDAFAEAVRTGADTAGLLTGEEERGLELFLGEGNCHFCHFGPNFSNTEFHNIGLGSRDWLDEADQGRYDGISRLLQDPFNSAGDYSDDPELGARKIDHLVRSAEQIGQYKTPSLRNLVTTAPYMHGGHFETLTEVIEFYSELDETPSAGHREELLVEHDWSAEDIASLVAFLESLEGEPLDPSLTGPPSAR